MADVVGWDRALVAFLGVGERVVRELVVERALLVRLLASWSKTGSAQEVGGGEREDAHFPIARSRIRLEGG